MKKSIRINSILNVIQNMVTVIVPMFTFPYVSRVLGVTNIGKINFANSVISYFLLLANLGAVSYAGREIALVRNNQKKANEVASEIFTLNILAMAFSYILLILLIMNVSKFEQNKLIILIVSCNIFSNVVATSWVFNAFEEYTYMTIRNIIAQIVSVVFLYIFIRREEDYLLYALLTQGVSVVACICDVVYRHKFIDIKLIISKRILVHFKPIMLMFGISLAGNIYVNSDVTMLGFMTSDYEVGLYSAALKIYTMVKTFLSAIIIVVTPRLTMLVGEKKEKEYTEFFGKSLNIIFALVLPMALGLGIVAPDVVEIFCGAEYDGSKLTLKLLCLSLLCSVIAYLFMSGVLLPNKRDKDIMRISVSSAIINVVANIVLIPLFKQNAAAFTTFLSEAFMLFEIVRISFKYVNVKNNRKTMMQILFCTAVMGIAVIGFQYSVNHIWVRMIGSVIVGGVIYVAIMAITKNEVAMDAIREIERLKSRVFKKDREKR